MSSDTRSTGMADHARMKRRHFLHGAVASIVGVAAMGVSSGLAHAQSAAKLVIQTKAGQMHMDVDVASSRAELSRGLMFRRSMPENYGMLFDYKRPQVVTMWMKNTFIPLDMVFLDTDGIVVHLVERTVPLSTKTISSNVPVRAVLEINAGISNRIGLRRGDRVYHPMFNNVPGG